MSGEGQDFRVDPGQLDLIANRIDDLYDEVSGEGGNYPGSYDKFVRDAAVGNFTIAWKSIEDQASDSYPPVNAYGAQYTGMDKKYAAIKDQLLLLAQACRSTAAEYRDRDRDTTDAVRHLDRTSAPAEGGR